MCIGGGGVLGKVVSSAESSFFCSVLFSFLGACQDQVDARIHAIIGVLCLVGRQLRVSPKALHWLPGRRWPGAEKADAWFFRVVPPTSPARLKMTFRD